MQLQQLQAAIEEADGDRALVSNVVKDAAAAGRLAFKDMKRLVKGCDALAQPTTCLGELALNAYTAKLEHCGTLPAGPLCTSGLESIAVLLHSVL